MVLTRGSSSCTISPLAKIRTILPGVLVPAGLHLSSHLKKTKHQFTRDKEMLAFNGRNCNSGGSHWWPLLSRHCVYLVKRREINASYLLEGKLSDIEAVGKQLEYYPPPATAGMRLSLWPKLCGRSAEAGLTPPHSPGAGPAKGVSGWPQSIHPWAAEKEREDLLWGLNKECRAPRSPGSPLPSVQMLLHCAVP